MKEFLTFGLKYSQKEFDANKVVGFRRVKLDIDKAWYGGNVKSILKQNDGPILIFVGSKGTIDAGVRSEDFEALPLDLMRQVYANAYGKEKKSWGKPEMIAKLTGKPVT